MYILSFILSLLIVIGGLSGDFKEVANVIGEIVNYLLSDFGLTAIRLGMVIITFVFG